MRFIQITRNPILLFSMLAVLAACNGQNQPATQHKAVKELAISIPIAGAIGSPVSDLGKNIDCIFQDKNNDYWFASNGEGVYRYDGKTLQHITEKDGLCSNMVWSIQEDVNGKLWLATRDGICSFDGKRFSNYTDSITHAPYGKLRYQSGGLFFYHLDGICFYDGKSFTNFTIHPANYKPERSNLYRPYGVYCTLADSSGKVWFGTQEKGVGVYDGINFSFLTDKDLGGPAVRSVFQDTKGIYWFGNNGGGLYRYDGASLRNITEEKDLGNAAFLKGKQPVDKPGSLARVFAINEDKQGNLWIGTADAGVWKYDGTNLTNYANFGNSAVPGITGNGNSVTVLYKDKAGELWLVANGDAVYRLDGKGFSRVAF